MTRNYRLWRDMYIEVLQSSLTRYKLIISHIRCRKRQSKAYQQLSISSRSWIFFLFLMFPLPCGLVSSQVKNGHNTLYIHPCYRQKVEGQKFFSVKDLSLSFYLLVRFLPQACLHVSHWPQLCSATPYYIGSQGRRRVGDSS